MDGEIHPKFANTSHKNLFIILSIGPASKISNDSDDSGNYQITVEIARVQRCDRISKAIS